MQGKEKGITGNMSGDGFQNGGLLIVKEGKIIYSFIQENPADHASNEDILKVKYDFQLCSDDAHRARVLEKF